MRLLSAISMITMLLLMNTASTRAYSQVAIQQASPTGTPEAKFEDFDPKNFDTPINIDNTWLPLKPGAQLTYEGFTDENGVLVSHQIVFVVTELTKVIAGVRTVVTWDQDFGDGQLQESELSFYAQDNDGSVWLMGEYPEAYENGKLVETPTWIHGFEDAHAGIIVQAKPQLGTPSYSEGWGPAVNWSDRGQTDQMGLETCVPADCYKDVLVIKEYSEDEPGAFQFKYYAHGVGNVRVDWGGTDTTKEKLELVKVEQLSPEALATANTEALKLEKRAYQLSKNAYGQTTPAEYPEGTIVPADATIAPTAESPQSASGPQPGHWEGVVSRAEGDTIVFDVMPENEIDNIELELSVGEDNCTAEIDLAPLTADGSFTLPPASDTNGILGQFDSQTTASGTVTIHDCGGNPLPDASDKAEYTWSAQWVSNEVGFGNRSDMSIIS